MQVLTDPRIFQSACLAARREGDLGFVPTMGFLHDGHESLLREAAKHRTSALSIFVNPSQFGPNEDLARYPRDLEGDLARAKRAGIDLVFTPTPEAMYPRGFQTWVEPGDLGHPLEGAHRPGHFRGMATIVLKLLQLAQPTHAYFGRKDYQQLAIVKRMARDFDLPVEIVGAPTVREPDGLAMSSRNTYLTPEERRRALCLSWGIEAARQAFASGERRVTALEQLARAQVASGADHIDYVSLRDADTLGEIDHAEPGRTVLLIAAKVGKTRLIDNAVLGE